VSNIEEVLGYLKVTPQNTLQGYHYVGRAPCAQA